MPRTNSIRVSAFGVYGYKAADLIVCTWTLDLKSARFSECGQPGFLRLPFDLLWGLNEEQLKEFVAGKLTISHWDGPARRRDRQSCCLSGFR